MLILSRKINEEIEINGEITIKILSISDNQVKVGIVAPKEVRIARKEIIEKIKENSIIASQSSKNKPEDLSGLTIKKM